MGVARMDLGPVVRDIHVPLLRLALKAVEKAVKEADSTCAVIDVKSSDVALTREKAAALREEIDGNIDREQFSITQKAADAAVIGLSIVLARLFKIKEDQGKLLVQPTDTEKMIDAATNLVDFLRDTAKYQELSGGAR